MSTVTKVCDKCGKMFEAKVPIGMDEIDRQFWENEVKMCESCYQGTNKPPDQPYAWDSKKWDPKQHDGGVDINQHVKTTRGISIVDFGDDD